MSLTQAQGVAPSHVISVPILIFSVLVSAGLGYYLYYRIKYRRFYELAAKLPGPPTVPLIGNIQYAMGDAHTIFTRLMGIRDDYDTIARFWGGPKMVVVISHPGDIETILGSNVHLDKSPEYRFFKPWLGEGLLISSGQHWRSHRKLIAPTFHLHILKSFIPLFNKNARETCAKMAALSGQEFDCHDYMSACTVEILLETAMGVNKKNQNHNGLEYAKAVMEMCTILHFRTLRPWLYPDVFYNLTSYKKVQDSLLNTIHSLTKKVIRQRKQDWATGVKKKLNAALESPKPEEGVKKSEERAFGEQYGLKDDLDVDDNEIGVKKRVAFLDLLIESAENGIIMNDNDIKEEVDTIMFEGHDTTAAGSSFFLSMMAAHPEVQERVIQEMDDIFGDSDRDATFQDTLEMKYLERCLMETLRLYPPVPGIARQIKEEVKLEGSRYTLPAGSTVAIVPYITHRDPRNFANPTKFDPDNFLPERMAERHYYSFIPFSAGPRSCVGRKYALLKLKIILSTIMRSFRVSSNLREEDFRLQADIILKREEGFRIQLHPRPGREGLLTPNID